MTKRSLCSALLLSAVLALSACTKNYTPDEALVEDLHRGEDAREEEEVDRQVGQGGGRNREALREGASRVERGL